MLEHPPTFRIGLSHLNDGPLIRAVRALGAPLLISANCLARKYTDPRIGPPPHSIDLRRAYKRFQSFQAVPDTLNNCDVFLDSAGFIACRHYGGYLWGVHDYMHLAASFPFRLVSSLDLAAEPELASNDDEVLRRIAITVRLYRECRGYARDLNVPLIPIIQGYAPWHYIRCAELLGLDDRTPIVGLGSVCRRHTYGENGLLPVLDALDRALPKPVRLHLFGVKTRALTEAIRSFPDRIYSCDSQAWDVAASRALYKRAIPKSQANRRPFLEAWWRKQRALVEAAWSDVVSRRARPVITDAVGYSPPAPPTTRIERAIHDAREEFLALVAAGEIDDLSERHVFDLAMERLADETDNDEKQLAA